MEITSFWTQKNWIKLKMAGTPECHGWQGSSACSLESTHRRQQKHGHGLFTGCTSRIFFLSTFSLRIVFKTNIWRNQFIYLWKDLNAGNLFCSLLFIIWKITRKKKMIDNMMQKMYIICTIGEFGEKICNFDEKIDLKWFFKIFHQY